MEHETVEFRGGVEVRYIQKFWILSQFNIEGETTEFNCVLKIKLLVNNSA